MEDDAYSDINLIKIFDPTATFILCKAKDVRMYVLHTDTGGETDCEFSGECYIYIRNDYPKHCLLIINPVMQKYFQEPIVADLSLEVQCPILLYKKGEIVFTIVFDSGDDYTKMTEIFTSIVRSLANDSLMSQRQQTENEFYDQGHFVEDQVPSTSSTYTDSTQGHFVVDQVPSTSSTYTDPTQGHFVEDQAPSTSSTYTDPTQGHFVEDQAPSTSSTYTDPTPTNDPNFRDNQPATKPIPIQMNMKDMQRLVSLLSMEKQKNPRAVLVAPIKLDDSVTYEFEGLPLSYLLSVKPIGTLNKEQIESLLVENEQSTDEEADDEMKEDKPEEPVDEMKKDKPEDAMTEDKQEDEMTEDKQEDEMTEDKQEDEMTEDKQEDEMTEDKPEEPVHSLSETEPLDQNQFIQGLVFMLENNSEFTQKIHKEYLKNYNK